MTETRTAILSYAENRETFRFSDLFLYLNKLFNISKVTLSWYLRDMVNANILFKLGRGIYTSRNVPTSEYLPRLSRQTIIIAKKIAKSFPFISISVWDGDVIADFQHHVSRNNVHYVEVDRSAMEAVFHHLKQNGYTVFLNPDKDFTYNNIDMQSNAFIVKPLISESPLVEYHGVKTPRLEKLLVDILCDEDMDYLHGNEWNHIFNNAHAMYSINRTTMLRYASRRNVQLQIETAIKNLGNNYD